MHNKIQDFIEGKFQYGRPVLRVPDEPIKFEVLENSIYKGEFNISSENGMKVCGVITCSRPNMICLTPQFDAATATVRFEYHATKQEAGCTDCGEFVVSSSSGEYVIPFEASVKQFYFMSSIGQVKTINDFANLAKLNWDEALVFFQSQHFERLICDEKTKLLYRGLCQYSMSSHEMEEFLIGTGKKERCSFEVDMPYQRIEKLDRIEGGKVKITKGQWGYIDIAVSSDTGFIRPAVRHIQSSDFTGMHAVLDYDVDANYLHIGKNFGRLILETPFQRKEIVVEAYGAQLQSIPAVQRHTKEQQQFMLISKYTEFILGHMSRKKWAQDSCAVLNEMIHQEPENIWNHLFLCHVYLMAEQKAEVAPILLETQQAVKDTATPLSCYWRYLNRLLTGGTGSEEELLEEVREAYRKYHGHPVLFFIMLNMEGAYRDEGRRYRELKLYLKRKSAGPVFYLEAYRLIREYPSVLKEMDIVEFRILLWAAKQQILTERMIQAAFESAVRVKGFHRRFFWLLVQCWKVAPSTDAIKVICTYLIKNGITGEAYFQWFDRAVEKELRIAGLCEAYIRSWHNGLGDIPEWVIHFFSANPMLSAEVKAKLFAWMVENWQRFKGRFEEHAYSIMYFGNQELQKGHINDRLAVIYEWMRSRLSSDEWKTMARSSIYSQKIVCDTGRFSKAVVFQNTGEHRQSSPLMQNTAFVRIYGPDYQILFEDSGGHRYFLQDGYEKTPVLIGTDASVEKISEKKNSDNQQKGERQTLEEKLSSFSDSIACLDRCIGYARELGMDTAVWEEKLFRRMLFTETFVNHHVDYFISICGQDDPMHLRDAYVSYFSWRYLIFDETVPGEIFEYLEYEAASGVNLNACCETALLKYYCTYAGELGVASRELFEGLLESQLEAGCFYPFYNSIPETIRRKYMLHDSVYLSYIDRPHRKISCRLIRECREGMIQKDHQAMEPFPGMYVVSVRLFADETFRYAFYESLSEANVLKTGIEQTPDTANSLLSRYGELNRLLVQAGKNMDAMKKYAEMCDMAEVLFQPL